jgi:hypothetical protein
VATNLAPETSTRAAVRLGISSRTLPITVTRIGTSCHPSSRLSPDNLFSHVVFHRGRVVLRLSFRNDSLDPFGRQAQMGFPWGRNDPLVVWHYGASFAGYRNSSTVSRLGAENP